MVSLIDKCDFRNSYNGRPKIKAFIDLLTKSFDGAHDFKGAETDHFYFGFISAIHSNNAESFSKSYDEFKLRQPSSESPWVQNDFFVFVLILGVRKFDLDISWVEKVIAARGDGNDERVSTNRTFSNLLTGNYTDLLNRVEVVIVFLDYLDERQLPKETLDTSYQFLSAEAGSLNSHDDFIRVISMLAFDMIILSKEAVDSADYLNLKGFAESFKKRVSRISTGFYVLICIVILATSYYYYRTNIDFQILIEDFDTIFGFLGIGGLLVLINKWVRMLINWVLLWILGYRKYFN